MKIDRFPDDRKPQTRPRDIRDISAAMKRIE
jgi:hypothetical protein